MDKNFKEAWESSDLRYAPNISLGYIKTKRGSDKLHRLFYVGTKNEVFAGETFRSALEARMFFKVQRVKAQNNKGLYLKPLTTGG